MLKRHVTNLTLPITAVMAAGLWAGTVTATPPTDGHTLTEIPTLAEQGRFDQVLTTLQSQASVPPDPRLASLQSDLERYQQHEAERATKRQLAYHEALQKMAEKLQQEDYEEALLQAIDAHGLAADPALMLADPITQELVTTTEKVAEQAVAENDWIEALNLYRALDLLYNDLATYRADVQRASRHLRVLRLYAPDVLEGMLVERARARGDEEEDRLHIGDETWEEKLELIDQSMLRQSLAHAARRHVSNTGYDPLLDGAIDALMTLAKTKGLEGTFPGLGDEAKASRFCDELVKLRAQVQQHTGPFNYFDAASVVDKIIALNGKTVELPERVIIYELTEGSTSRLDDFSAVIWPRLKKNFNRNTQGKFYGVGIQISIRDDRLVVVSPLEDTPASKAGIHAGDIIVTVDDKDTSIWTLDQAVREITGPEGTKVTLGIRRVGEREVLDFDLTRAEIVIESIRGWQRRPAGGWSYMLDPELKIGYVRLTQFIPQTAVDLDRAINQLIEQEGGLEGLILDLRFNPGGLLSAAVEVVDRFIPTGAIVSTVGSSGERTSQFRAKEHRTHKTFPMVVLINEGSASASEIVAGALQDHQRANVVGTRSFGKGSVQDLFPLDGGRAYLKLTTQYYALPNGRIIHRVPDAVEWGIEPNLTIKMSTQQVADAIEFRQEVDVLRTDEEIEQLEAPVPTAGNIIEGGLDPQLEASLLLLKTKLLAQDVALASTN